MNSPLEQKLREIIEINRKAAKIIKNHPGQSFEQIKKTVDLNIASHVSTSNHVALFVYNVMNRKGDLKTLADSAAKRIVLSDSRIETAFQSLSPVEKAAKAEKIYNLILSELVSYFENLKGKNIDQNKIIEELTTQLVKKIAEILAEKK